MIMQARVKAGWITEADLAAEAEEPAGHRRPARSKEMSAACSLR
jgi:hypothetical protein